MPELSDLAPQLTKMLEELDKRSTTVTRLKGYARGTSPIPPAVEQARMRNAYAALMGMAQAPWAGLVIDSVQDRLEASGIRAGGNKEIEEPIWGVWQANALDAESKLCHHGVLRDGRAFATIWREQGSDIPEIVYDGADQMIVAYREGRHQPRHRVAAVRRWVDADDGKRRLTLYTATYLYKLKEAKEPGGNRPSGVSFNAGGTWWEQRQEGDEQWPLPNPWEVVPVVEVATNRELQSGRFPFARGEFADCTGLLDRINLLTFLGLVVAVWMGFPLRYVLGDRILRDDNNDPLPPFDSKPDSVVQLEDVNAKIGQLQPADRGNLSIFGELSQFAYITKTPAHYFPADGGFSNISADTIRSLEGGLHAKVDGIHKPFIGEGHEEILRVAGLQLDTPVVLPPTAELVWADRQSRSLAESADAASKLKDILPGIFIAEKYLGLTQDELDRVQQAAAGSALDKLLNSAANGSGTQTAAA